jgi:hypothetical protein
VRGHQPLMVLDGPPPCPRIQRCAACARRARRAAPVLRRDVHRGGRCLAARRRRGSGLPGARAGARHAGRAFARFHGDDVVFKAEVGAATRSTCQVQGVWVAPRYRGRGLSVGGMAAVVN